MKRNFLLALSLLAVGVLAGCTSSGPNDPSVDKVTQPVAAQNNGEPVKPSPRRQMMNPALGSSNEGGGSDKL